jgi:hypothetical protein
MMSRERLGARSDFDEWTNAVVAAVKKHRSRFGGSSAGTSGQARSGLRRWASRKLTKIAD